MCSWGDDAAALTQSVIRLPLSLSLTVQILLVQFWFLNVTRPRQLVIATAGRHGVITNGNNLLFLVDNASADLQGEWESA